MWVQLLMLLIANILFGIAPVFVGNLEGLSSFSISFYRFFGASLIEILVIIIVFFIFQRKLSAHGIKKTYGQMVKEVLKNYYTGPNSHFLKGRKQFYYLAFLGFLLVNLSVPFYFLSYRLAGLVVSTIFVNSFTLLIIAVNNWIRREERMDMLKLLYLLLLIAAIFTIAFSNHETEQNSMNMADSLVIVLVIAAYSAFLIWLGLDSSSKFNMIKNINFTLMVDGKELEKIALFLRALLKLAAIHLFGAILLLPFTGFIYLISPNTLIGQYAGNFLFVDLKLFFQEILDPSIFLLIILCTAIPYFLLNLSTSTWPQGATKHDIWASIFTLIDPLCGLYIGYLMWQEPIKPDYILFTTIFLIAGIFIRYFSGSINTRKFLFIIKVKHDHKESFLNYIQKIREIDQINMVVGTFDFVLHITVQNMARLAQIATKINYFQGIEYAYYTVEDACM